MGFTQQDTRPYAAGQAQPSHGTHLGGHHNATTTANGTPTVPITHTSATGPAPTTAGPHRHDIANKLDPRVDSDLAGTGVTGGTTNAYGHGNTANSSVNPGAPLHHNRHHTDAAVPVAAGLGAGAGAGAGLGHSHNYTTQGGNAGLGTTGHTHNPGAAHSHGVGAQHTVGPHHSDALNKLDPTVDSRTGLRK